MAYSPRTIFATLPRTQRGQPLVLGGDPKGVNFLYTNGNSVIIRNIKDPAIADIYTEHSCTAIVAKYSPSGFYIASGDQSGKVRIWDTVNKEHILKNEFHPIGGPIKDIAWSMDNQRMVVVGEGRERFGHIFMSETGTSVGEISGQSKPINSCDFRPTRPFRVVTGSEDNTVAVFEGPPFKFRMTKQDHSRFVQVVRYSPNGQLFASAGFDGKVFLYEGTGSDLVGELGAPAHAGGVYGLSWSPDGRQVLTASGDKTVKLWDVETRQMVTQFSLGSTVDDQQVSCLWQNEYLLTVSLSGFINYLDVNDSSAKPWRIIKGHNKPITVLTADAPTNDRNERRIFTGSHDGFITSWCCHDGQSERIQGTGHGNQINGMQVHGNVLYTCGIDDSLKQVNIEENTYLSKDVKLGSQPHGLSLLTSSSSTDAAIVFVATIKAILVVDGATNTKVAELPVNYEPSCIAVNNGGGDSDVIDVAVGGAQNNRVHIYQWHRVSRRLQPLNGGDGGAGLQLEHMGPPTDAAYSPDAHYLVVSDAHRKVVLYAVPDYQLAHKQEWGFHNARVNCVAWSPDSSLVASGSLDTSIIVWSVEKPAKHIIIKNAHAQSQVTRLVWLDGSTLVSVGQDCNTKLWTIDKC